MEIKYNGVSIDSSERSNGILTFTDVPNILEFNEELIGENAQLTISPTSGWAATVTADNQYYFSILGETITNVMSPNNAKNKNFFISNDVQDTTISIVRALRNCSTISAGMNILPIDNSGNDVLDTVLIVAKNIGEKFVGDYIQRNVPQSLAQVTLINRGAQDENNTFGSKIDVEVMKGNTYITTLEKSWYGNGCAFDVTPVIATMVEPKHANAEITLYDFNLFKYENTGHFTNLGYVYGYVGYGYLANDSKKYLPIEEQILNNCTTNDLNKQLYTYDSTIPFSVLARTNNTNSFEVEYKFMDNAKNTLSSTSVTYNTGYGDPQIYDVSYTVPQDLFSASTFIEITLGGQTLSFEIIRPLKATESWQRIMWRNEYGGISFFDFTSSVEESENLDIKTYNKNIFDFYENPAYEKRKMYSNKVTKTVKVKSHLIGEDGKYIFNSLVKSKKVWISDNDKIAFIIPTGIEVKEDGTYNNVYTATLTYEFSDSNYV